MRTTQNRAPRGREKGDNLIAEKLELLIDTVHPNRAKPLTQREIAAMIAAGLVATGKSIATELRSRYQPVSASSISAITSRANPNPTVETLRSLAWFFGRNLGFFDDADPDALRELRAERERLQRALTDGPLALAAARASTLSPRSQRAVVALIEHLAGEEEREHAAGGAQETGGGS